MLSIPLKSGRPPHSLGRDQALFAELGRNARSEDAGHQTLLQSIGTLKEAGWFLAALPSVSNSAALGSGGNGAMASVAAFIDLAAANLSLARIFEGHVNAVRLVGLYADRSLRERCHMLVRNGGVLGVWGADGRVPVSISADGSSLEGGKNFASGLGAVSSAVITIKDEEGTTLCFADVTDETRCDHSAWSMSGMRATSSGAYDFGGLTSDSFECFGQPDDYFREPHFIGGVWRIAAVQLGGIFGLMDAARQALQKRDRLSSPDQIARLSPILYRAEAARGLVEKAARLADGIDGHLQKDRAVALSIFARLLTEEIGQQAIAAVERSVGLQHFDAEADTGRIARDLATYMRQAAGDAFLQKAGKSILEHAGPLQEFGDV